MAETFEEFGGESTDTLPYYPEEQGEGYGEEAEGEAERVRFTSRVTRKRIIRKPIVEGLNYNVREDREECQMSVERDVLTTKARLQGEEIEPHRINLFDHFSAVIYKFITERPERGGNLFEEYSKKIKKIRFIPKTDHVQDMFIPPQFSESETVIRLLKSVQQRAISREATEGDDSGQANLLELFNYFEQVGISLPPLEMFCVRIKLQNLIKKHRVRSYRFWGKVFGIYDDYFVAETEQFPDDIQRLRQEQEMDELAQKEEGASGEKHVLAQQKLEELHAMQAVAFARQSTAAAAVSDAAAAMRQKLSKKGSRRSQRSASSRGTRADQEERSASGEHEEELLGEEQDVSMFMPQMKPPPDFPPLPVSTYEKPPEVPREKRGDGVNKKVYFVCRSKDEEWIMLPDVTPRQIQVSRKIRKLLTGDLNTEILTYPPFPGKEIHLLRAQIARISASTHVSPKGFYKVEGGGGVEESEDDEDEEVEEEEEDIDNGKHRNRPLIENPSYRPKGIKQLLNLKNWVHHQAAILLQGRTTFWSMEEEKQTPEGEEEEVEEEEEEEEKLRKSKVEIVPPLFRPLSRDASPLLQKLWTVHASSTLLPETAIVVLRSELWPGSVSFSSGRKFENIYVGWAQKYVPFNHTHTNMPLIAKEYPIGPEIMEMNDPTWEQEEEWRKAHEPKPKPMRMSEELGEQDEESMEEEEEEERESEEDED